MTDILANATPIDPSDPQYRHLLQNLQGNILKGHGRDHAILIFFAFNRPPAEVRPRLKEVSGRVGSAASQLKEAAEFRASGKAKSAGLFANLFFTATGYEGLGFDRARLRDEIFPWMD